MALAKHMPARRQHVGMLFLQGAWRGAMMETGTDSRIRTLKLACDVRLISAQQAAESSVFLNWWVAALRAVLFRENVGRSFAGHTIQFSNFNNLYTRHDRKQASGFFFFVE